MKKSIIILLSILFLVACQDSNQPSSHPTPDPGHSTPEKEELETESTPSTPNETSLNLDETSPSENSKDWADLPEYTVITEIATENYQVNIETDNPNNRVIFLENQSGEKLYKSIFIKNTNRLKIIDLKNDNLIYNQVI